MNFFEFETAVMETANEDLGIESERIYVKMAIDLNEIAAFRYDSEKETIVTLRCGEQCFIKVEYTKLLAMMRQMMFKRFNWDAFQ